MTSFRTTRRKTPVSSTQKTPTEPLSVSDDEFTWWFDETFNSMIEVKSVSPYEYAALAWNEAVRRCLEHYKKNTR